jgi:hypothetical protein
MRRTRIGITAGALLAVVMVGSAGAQSVAPPGDCAEPRGPLEKELDTPRALDTSQVELRGDPLFAVAGRPRGHFSPTDVAAGVGTDDGRPEQPNFLRSACDAPDAGCARILEPSGSITLDTTVSADDTHPTFP